MTGVGLCTQPTEQDTGNHYVNAEDTVLGFQKSHGTFRNMLCNALHLCIASVLFCHPILEKKHINEAYNPENW